MLVIFIYSGEAEKIWFTEDIQGLALESIVFFSFYKLLSLPVPGII